MGFASNVPKAQKPFWTHPMVLVGDEAQVQASFGPFRDSANLDVDRCMVCAKHTIGSETFLDTPDGTHRRRGSCGISFWCVRRRC